VFGLAVPRPTAFVVGSDDAPPSQSRRPPPPTVRLNRRDAQARWPLPMTRDQSLIPFDDLRVDALYRQFATPFFFV